MTFDELQNICEEKLGIIRLADTARELDVTPQVVSNWKARNQVPYKYVKALRKKVREIERSGMEMPTGSPDSDQGRLVLGYPAGGYSENEQSITEIIIFIYHTLRDKKLTILISSIIFIIIAMVHLKYFSEPVYTSTAKIMPIEANNNRNASLQGLAQRFGLSGGSEQINSLSSSIMFPEVIKSRRLAREILSLRFGTKKYGPDNPLINILYKTNIESKKWSEKAQKNAVNKLLDMIGVKTNRSSPLITLKVSTFEAQLSADIASAIIEKLEKILIQFKLSRVKEKKLFIENRIAEVDIDLRKAEENLKVFRERNRNILSSPALLLEQERLFREAEVQTQIYITLKNQYEMAQIEEVEKSSMMEILDPPESPTAKTSPKPRKNIISATFLGVFFGICLIFFNNWYMDNKDSFTIPK